MFELSKWYFYIDIGKFSIIYDGDWSLETDNDWFISDIYPRSLSDLKTLIDIFTPNN